MFLNSPLQFKGEFFIFERVLTYYGNWCNIMVNIIIKGVVWQKLMICYLMVDLK